MSTKRRSNCSARIVGAWLAMPLLLLIASCNSEEKRPLIVQSSRIETPVFEVGESFRFELQTEGGAEGTEPIDWAHDELPWWISVTETGEGLRRLVIEGRAPLGSSREAPYRFSFQARGKDRRSVSQLAVISFRVDPLVREFTDLQSTEHPLHGRVYQIQLDRTFGFRGDERSTIRITANTGGLKWDSARCDTDEDYCLDFIAINDEDYGQLIRQPVAVEGETSHADIEGSEIVTLNDNRSRNAIRDGTLSVAIITSEMHWTLSGITIELN